MSSTIGEKIKISVFGESHGKAIGIVVDGLPTGMKIDMDKVLHEMKRRAPGNDKTATPRKEADFPEILSGVVDNVLTGAPLCAIIHNNNTKSKDYSDIKRCPRPGHSDYPAYVKYNGFNDIAGGGHFSGRITAPIVFAGAVCKQLLEEKGIKVTAHINSIGNVYDEEFNPCNIDNETIDRLLNSSFPLIDESKEESMRKVVTDASADKDSVGGKHIETANKDVILDYHAAVGLLSTFISAFSAENVQRGRSILQGKLNTEIVSPNLSIIDDNSLEGALGSSNTDGEGTVSCRTSLVENGILKSFLYDIYTANKEGCESTANGYRGSFSGTPSVSPSNLIFDFKDSAEISDMADGILATSVLGAHTANPISGDFSVEVSNAFEISNGDIGSPIKKAMISGNIFELLKDCEKVNSEIKQYGSFIIPQILVHNLRVVGQE